MIRYQCDFCKSLSNDKGVFAKLTLKMSLNYPKYNSVKGMFSDAEWDLCPICFERITKDIKVRLETGNIINGG